MDGMNGMDGMNEMPPSGPPGYIPAGFGSVASGVWRRTG
jgi:hypothetical protein